MKTQVNTKQTISIITYNEGTITSVFCFDTDADGIKGAETKFMAKIIAYEEDELDNEDLETYVEDGFYESARGELEIYIVWSDMAIVELD